MDSSISVFAFSFEFVKANIEINEVMPLFQDTSVSKCKFLSRTLTAYIFIMNVNQCWFHCQDTYTQ